MDLLDVYTDKRSGGDLYRYLRCQKPRRKRYGSYDRRGCIPNQVSIDERPAVVDARRRFGDWEGDTVIGKGQRGALVTLVERKSLYTVIRSVLHKTAEAVRHAVVDGLAPYIDWVHTITYDNGREFADHEGMARDLDARIYFAHPYASWERGLNENTNGLIRQYFPKHRDLTTVTQQEIDQAMDKLNHRPRKSLGFRTPYEVFFNTVVSRIFRTFVWRWSRSGVMPRGSRLGRDHAASPFSGSASFPIGFRLCVSAWRLPA